MAVDNLPCELPRESSQWFSETLLRFIPDIMNTDFTVADFDAVALPFEIKNAVILYQGKLTPSYQLYQQIFIRSFVSLLSNFPYSEV